MTSPSSHAAPTVAFVSTYGPKRCGLATFTGDLRAALGDDRNVVIAVDDVDRDFPQEVVGRILKSDRTSYLDAARLVNSNWDAVSLQHEYGIFGGSDGDYVLDFLAHLEVPCVTTLHTVLQRPSEGQRTVLQKVCELSAHVMVMSDRASDILETVYGVPGHKIETIPHGVPDSDGVVPAAQMAAFGDDPKLLTFGLLSPGKGIEVAIDAVAKIAETHPNVRYFVLGQTHPDLVARDGESYRDALAARAEELGVKDNVIFVNEYTSLDKLCTYLAGADLYITPYRSKDQIVSGTLSYAVGFGLPVITTPFVYAEELVEKGGGLLFPFDDSARLASLVTRLLDDDAFRTRLSRSAHALGKSMRWNVVGRRLNGLFASAIPSEPRTTVQDLVEERVQTPAISMR